MIIMGATEAIIKMAKENHGTVTTAMVVAAGFSRGNIKYLVDKGMIEKSSRGIYILPEVSIRRRNLPVSRISVKTCDGSFPPDFISSEFRQYHKFCYTITRIPFLHMRINHDKSQQPACFLLPYKTGIPSFFCKIISKPWIFKQRLFVHIILVADAFFK